MAWRKSWEKEIDRTGWIPQSAANRIVETYPHPDSGDSLFHNSIVKSNTLRELLAEFATHNVQHLNAQKAKLKSFFDTVEASPLTDEQTDACICMDDAVQIVAAAGSGKTSTMVAKTGYVLKEELAKPEEILLLAFNTKAAEELRQRIHERLSGFEDLENVTVSTFHAFGYNQVLKKSRDVARWVGSPVQEVEMITAIVQELSTRDKKFGTEWDLFRTVYGRAFDHPKDLVQPDDDGRGNIRTANGEWVKSQEERFIADWLFFHGVRYQYERDYEHPTRTQTHQQYRPDFYYPDVQLYHEHFALDGNGKAPPRFTGDYVAGVRWKRHCHAAYETDLLETTSYSLRNGEGLEHLANALRDGGVELAFDSERPTKGQAPVSSLELANLIRTFHQHAKSSGIDTNEIEKAHKSSSASDTHLTRASRFLSLYVPIAEEWERRLQETNCIDFDDMLIQAAEMIENGQFSSPYTMIFADEYQDSSRARVRLLKALLEQSQLRGHLCVVGDDWQSINQFAGADPSLMAEFNDTFPQSSQLKLATTFRCPQSLCDASSKFISVNPSQIQKDVQTTNPREGPSIAAYAFPTTDEALQGVEKHLERLHTMAASGDVDNPTGRLISVLLLGRYKHERPKCLNKWKRQFRSQLQVEFRTVHAAKGSEADYVMILNMVEDACGFPSQLADDPILRLAMPRGDDFPMAEERRVFYVALTRARRQVRIYTKSSSPSRFLVEMAKEGLIKIGVPGRSGTLEPCPKCKGGTMAARSGSYGPFESCNLCRFKRNLSSDHRIEKGNRVSLRTPMAPGTRCPTCSEGTMLERSAPFKPFVGCDKYPKCQTTAPLQA